jgi:rhodanese-related sulfurtransferase
VDGTGTEFFSMDLLLPVLIGMGAVLLFRMMPRLLARGVPFVAPKDLKARMDRGDDLLVVDVRSEKEFTGRTGHVPGALNLPLDQIGPRLAALGGETDVLGTPVFLICQTASRAAHAARVMKKAGFRDLSVVSGGMSAWRGQGLPTRQGGDGTAA